MIVQKQRLNPTGTMLNTFLAAPEAVCVKSGRNTRPKAHMPLWLWEENNDRGGFIHALDIDMTQGDLP